MMSESPSVASASQPQVDISEEGSEVGEKKDTAPNNDGKEGGASSEYNVLCREMFQKITDYLNGELAGTENRTLHRISSGVL